MLLGVRSVASNQLLLGICFSSQPIYFFGYFSFTKCVQEKATPGAKNRRIVPVINRLTLGSVLVDSVRNAHQIFLNKQCRVLFVSGAFNWHQFHCWQWSRVVNCCDAIIVENLLVYIVVLWCETSKFYAFWRMRSDSRNDSPVTEMIVRSMTTKR